MSIKATALVEKVREAHRAQWGYIWGMRGQLWTQARQDAATRDMTVRYGQQWVGRHVADCSGLLKWAFQALGGDVYHGSDTIFRKYTVRTGPVAGQVAIKPGTAVFMVNSGRRTHVGLYVGQGKCIEAQGTRTGVVESELSAWDEWGTLVGVDYTGVAAETIEADCPTLRRGDEGPQVLAAQELLLAAGFTVGEKGADGVFGRDTEAAVRALQEARGLAPDGVVGPLTWQALRAPEEPGEDEPLDPLPLEERIARLEAAVFGGGAPDE